MSKKSDVISLCFYFASNPPSSAVCGIRLTGIRSTCKRCNMPKLISVEDDGHCCHRALVKIGNQSLSKPSESWSSTAVLNLWAADLCPVGRDQGWELRNLFDVSHVSESMIRY